MPYKTLKFSVQVSVFSLMFAFSRFLAQNAKILVQPVLNLQKNWSESLFWKKSCISDGNHNLPYKTLKFSVCLNVFVNFYFFLLFGAKHKHTNPTSSKSAKDLVRISVLDEKLDLWWKLQFAAKDATI